MRDWKQSLVVAFSQLRRVNFLTQEVFAWGDFLPVIDWGGMATSNFVLGRARYLKIWKFLWFSLDFRATVAAPLFNRITVQIPGTFPVDEIRSVYQGGGLTIQNNGANEAGFWYAGSGTNLLNFQRTAGGNFTAGTAAVFCNGFVEIQ